jgi:RND family efflux transporter MFP subunit
LYQKTLYTEATPLIVAKPPFLKSFKIHYDKMTLRLSFSIVFSLSLIPLPFLTGCQRKPSPIAAPEPPVVTVESPALRSLDEVAEFTGRLAPIEKQIVQSQVTGYLQEILFKDGDLIEPGQPLYTIDPKPYEAALLNAKAMVAKSTADFEAAEKRQRLAKADWDRAQRASQGTFSQQDLDVFRTTSETASSALQAALGAVDSAKAAEMKAAFDRQNCTIRNSVSIPGRINRTQITLGNLVVAGQTILCEVTSLDPIFAYWEVDEETSLRYRRQVFDVKSIPDPRGDTKLNCWVGLKDEVRGENGKWPHQGYVDYLAPEIVRGSGTREVRGVLENDDYRLSPGDSIRVQVTSGATTKKLTVPEIAIGSQQQQKFVYCVVTKDGKSTAEFRPVKLGPVRELNGVRLQIIESGLTSEDKIVVNGLLRVRPGLEVKATEQSTPVGANPGKGR